jgi:trehalose/maltose hydrolase-like predicted phosphorylase
MPLPVYFSTPWILESRELKPELVVASGSNFLSGNGYLGYRGTFPHWRKEHYTACVVSDTWDNADGTWKELCNVPNALFLRIENSAPEAVEKLDLSLDLQKALTKGSLHTSLGDGTEVDLRFTRFADMKKLNRLFQRVEISAKQPCSLTISAGIDLDVWSLNGDHFGRCSLVEEAVGDFTALLGADLVTGESKLPVSVRHAITARKTAAGSEEETRLEAKTSPETGDGLYRRQLTIDLQKGEELVIDMAMTIFSANDLAPPDPEALPGAQSAELQPAAAAAAAAAATAAAAAAAAARSLAAESLSRGYQEALEEHCRCWQDLWKRYSVEVESDDDAWGILNFNSYHNIIATPAHTDHLPLGARGLSCQAYQGAAFWDQEIFNLPGHLHAEPETARKLLVYRYKTLAGARRKAEKLGYEGAFYAWVSGDTGDELCPDYFFRDVLTGRKIRNHFNDWQIHVSADIAYAVASYHKTTGDKAFYRNEGARILLEVARFTASRVVWLPRRQRYEIHQVLGPDEYHENANNNLFTNYQSRYALLQALELLDFLAAEAPEMLEQHLQSMQLTCSEIDLWKDIADKLYIPPEDPDTRLLPQFDGYFDLEDITPRELEARLKDPAEYWGWPNGIAYETQVIKQADVVQLFFQHPHLYDLETIRKNYRYYEKRTQHRSSLSPAVHSIVAARAGLEEDAYRYFLDAGLIDLHNSKPAFSGGTFIGGIHTAACGIARQMAVYGFAGVEALQEGVRLAPALPQQWKHLAFSWYYRGCRLFFEISPETARVSHLEGSETVTLFYGGRETLLEPGKSLSFEQKLP